MIHRELTQETVLALFPWEDTDLAQREQAEADIWADEAHDAWLAALLADQQTALVGGDPAYDRWVADGAPGVVWSLLDDAGVMADVWPAELRDDWIGA